MFTMNCHVTDLRNKEVINERTGNSLGCVCDVEVDTCCGKVVSIVIYGRSRGFGLFGREEDIVICWEDIRVIGEDTILVCFTPNPCRPRPQRRGGGFFNGIFK